MIHQELAVAAPGKEGEYLDLAPGEPVGFPDSGAALLDSGRFRILMGGRAVFRISRRTAALCERQWGICSPSGVAYLHDAVYGIVKAKGTEARPQKGDEQEQRASGYERCHAAVDADELVGCMAGDGADVSAEGAERPDERESRQKG